MRRDGRSPKYDGLIRGEINNHLTRMFAFGQIDFAQIYSVPPVTIVDEIIEKYLKAIEISDRLGKWDRPFDYLMGEVRFNYGTPYMANLLYRLAEYFEHMYDKCMYCPERIPCQFCDMDPDDIRKCIERREAKYWADLAAPSWGD